MNVLAINSGSSSLKFKVVVFDGPAESAATRSPQIRYEGAIEELGSAATLLLRRTGQTVIQTNRPIASHGEAVRCMMEMLEQGSRLDGQACRIEAVGHRVVHGGARFQAPVRIDDEVFAAIDRLAELAPLHNPGSLAGIKGARAVLGEAMPMVVVFDTAFHRSIPARAATYGIDLALAEKHGICRYGFHGIAHASMAGIAAAAMGRPPADLRLITVQLGNGCSAAAIDRGRSVDTSMGFTPLEGLVMGTRSGDLDPAVVAHLSRQEGMTVEQVERLLNEQSGLLGLSGLSRDMRALLRAAEEKPGSRAALAIDVFCYRVRKYIGAYLAVLGGAEAIVFGGGIGARSPAIRSRICAGMNWCGLRLDAARNDAATESVSGAATIVSEEGASVACYVAGVDEEVEIARATRDCMLQTSA